MADFVDPGSLGLAPNGKAGEPALPEWIQRQVSTMGGERVYCRDGKVRTVARVRQVNRTRGMLWFVVTTLEDAARPEVTPGDESPEERSICEMDSREEMSAHARFIECEPDYLRSYRDQTVRMNLWELETPSP